MFYFVCPSNHPQCFFSLYLYSKDYWKKLFLISNSSIPILQSGFYPYHSVDTTAVVIHAILIAKSSCYFSVLNLARSSVWCGNDLLYTLGANF